MTRRPLPPITLPTLLNTDDAPPHPADNLKIPVSPLINGRAYDLALEPAAPSTPPWPTTTCPCRPTCPTSTSPTSTTALGAHGMGEIGITGCATSAVFNAPGVRVRSLPTTLDKLLAG